VALPGSRVQWRLYGPLAVAVDGDAPGEARQESSRGGVALKVIRRQRGASCRTGGTAARLSLAISGGVADIPGGRREPHGGNSSTCRALAVSFEGNVCESSTDANMPDTRTPSIPSATVHVPSARDRLAQHMHELPELVPHHHALKQVTDSHGLLETYGLTSQPK
jgi:hypothetical protein